MTGPKGNAKKNGRGAERAAEQRTVCSQVVTGTRARRRSARPILRNRARMTARSKDRL